MTNISKNVIGKNVAATGAVLALAPWGWLATTCAIVYICGCALQGTKTSIVHVQTTFGTVTVICIFTTLCRKCECSLRQVLSVSQA